MTAVALHKGNVFWELSGWAPKYFPPQLKTDVRSRLKDKIMFGSDYPSIPYDRLFREWDETGYKDDVRERIFGTATPSAPWDFSPPLYAQLKPCCLIGSERIRFPVAAKIALQTAGATGGIAGSPRPVGELSVSRKCTSISGGAWAIRVG